jgi:hypothetical protein
LLAFRTGSYVHNLAERLNPTFEKSESWTHIYPGLGEAEASMVLEDFHQTNVRFFQPISPSGGHSQAPGHMLTFN